MINYINVPEGLYNLLSDDLQYNLKLVSNYFNIDSNQIMYDIDEIFDLCVKGIQTSSRKIIIGREYYNSILNFNKSNSLIVILYLRQGSFNIDHYLTTYNVIRHTTPKDNPYTFFCILRDNISFQSRTKTTINFLVR